MSEKKEEEGKGRGLPTRMETLDCGFFTNKESTRAFSVTVQVLFYDWQSRFVHTCPYCHKDIDPKVSGTMVGEASITSTLFEFEGWSSGLEEDEREFPLRYIEEKTNDFGGFCTGCVSALAWKLGHKQAKVWEEVFFYSVLEPGINIKPAQKKE